MPSHHEYLQLAVDEALSSVREGGGPFGAVIVRDGVILARGHNRVTLAHDPTAHAEVVAIRAACASLADHRLDGAILYASTEPCPLCLAASLWSRLSAIFYASDRHDAARAGFDDAVFYRELGLAPDARQVPVQHLPVAEGDAALTAWRQLGDKTLY